MEIQIAEAIELIKTLAETENLTQSQALAAFVAEAGLDIDSASVLKAELFEEYTLQDMASDSMTKALYSVFVSGEFGAEDIQEVDTKETGEGTKYKVRVKDRQSGSSYVRYATRAKVAELRANPNISSVEMTDYGSTGEDDRGEKTAAAKRGDRDGDGKVESGSKEHAGVVHNAIQRKMGGTPDGQDTRKEAFDAKGAARIDAAKGKKSETEDEKNKRLMLGKYSPAVRYAKKKEVEEGIDFKGARREDERREKIQKEKDKKNPSGKDRRLAMGKFRPGASTEERAEGGRDSMREKGTSPTKGGKKMFEAYLELRENRRAARAAGGYKDDSKKQTDPSKEGFTGISNSIADIMKQNKEIEAKKKKSVAEGWKPDPKEKRAKKSAKIARDESIESGKRDRDRDDAKVKDLYKRRMAVDFKKKKSQIGEGLVTEADLVDAGRENQSQRSRKKLDGKDVDNSRNVVLMPSMGESVQTETSTPKSSDRLLEADQNASIRESIRDLFTEECCPKCGTPECTCEEEKPKKKKKATIDESGMPIFETEQESRNNARPGPSKEMIDPPADPQGDVGHMNPKGLPKRYKEKGEAPGDRRPNDPSGPDLPNEKGTVPNGSGV